MQLETALKSPKARTAGALRFRKPKKADGAKVWNLIKSIEKLDDNSMYCNLLQCSHFAGTCALAELDGEPVGWISGYRPPESPDTLFVWQVAVHPDARGRGVAKRLIRELLQRPECRQVRHIHSTITRDNKASWALFRAIADDLDAPMADDAHFERETHFGGAHATEHLVEIGPFDRIALQSAA
ncbi:diaminobutyrate acetyltransferase [Pelagibius marinus]|uniref:diaminobutyrate acetyltransferase n=1 Tax=Pelagibius marinus TaxID=2762760 RepID=UPI0018733C47|nr:diaminobutyrate acetyltransferase [Pelagibius marinus]